MGTSGQNFGNVSSQGGPAKVGDAAQNREQLLTIGKLAKAHKISLRTLRFYEDRGLLHPQRRGTMGFYTASDCRRLEIVLKGKSLGFTLAEIRDFIDSVKDPAGFQNLARSLRPDMITAQIDHLERQRAEIDEAIAALREALEDCMPSDNGDHQR